MQNDPMQPDARSKPAAPRGAAQADLSAAEARALELARRGELRSLKLRAAELTMELERTRRRILALEPPRPWQPRMSRS